MTIDEFSNEFDILYNNIMSNLAPGLDEYEKSIFLTKALDEIIRKYFNPKENKNMEGYDGSPKRQIDFSAITAVANVDDDDTVEPLFDTRSNTKAVALPSNIMMIVNETVFVRRDGSLVNLIVVPVSYTEYARLMSKPYKRPIKSQAWRIINSSKADIIIGPNDTFEKYSIRYVKTPEPIILSTLTEGLTISGKSQKSTSCELDPIIHLEILQRAVELAKAAYTGNLDDSIALGHVSQTNVGQNSVLSK